MFVGGEIVKIKYICSYCGKEFDGEEECKTHEKQHYSKDWTVEDYIKWLNDASKEIMDNQKVTFGFTRQYLESSLDQKPIQVAAIFTNIAKLLAGEQKSTDTPTTGGDTGKATNPTTGKMEGATINE